VGLTYAYGVAIIIMKEWKDVAVNVGKITNLKRSKKMANNKSNTVDDILYMLLAEFENRSEEYKAIAYAIKTEEAIQFAKAVLPEKHLAEDCLSEYCGLHHSAGESVPQIDFEKMRLTIDVRNQTIDEVEPIIAKLIMEKNEAIESDAHREMELFSAKRKITELEAQKQSMGRTMWKDQKKISELEADNKDLEKEVIRYKEGG